MTILMLLAAGLTLGVQDPPQRTLSDLLATNEAQRQAAQQRQDPAATRPTFDEALAASYAERDRASGAPRPTTIDWEAYGAEVRARNGQPPLPPRRAPYRVAIDPASLSQRCADGAAAQGELLSGCVMRLGNEDRNEVRLANAAAEACETRPRPAGETLDACVTRRLAAQAATSAALVPLAPGARDLPPPPPRRQETTCTTGSYTRQDGTGGGVTFGCSNDPAEAGRAREALESVLRDD